MPVSFNVVDHPATGFDKPRVATAEELLKGSCPRQYRRSQGIVQTSFLRSQLREGHVSASDNGFVWAAYHAYSSHHHLCIRPEDIWFAILTQISFFINAHAEDLRDYFVEHQGQKHLHVEIGAPEFGYMATLMADMIAKNVKDPGLRDWVMPDFSTTKPDDSVVGAILFMGAMQKYFSLGCSVFCGLPSVTLLGEKSDWVSIHKRLDHLDLLGEEPALFAKLLRPILRRMIMSFDAPGSPEVIRFWNTIIHRHELFSGTDYLTGWLTAFCFWNEEGVAKGQEEKVLMDNVAYLFVDVDEIPAGFASVPVSVNDQGHEYNATMVAGSVGILASPGDTPQSPHTSNGAVAEPGIMQSVADSTAEAHETSETPYCKVQALSGWWMYEDESSITAEARAAEKNDLDKQLRELDLGNTERFWELQKRREELEAF